MHWRDEYFELFRVEPPSSENFAGYFESVLLQESDVSVSADDIGSVVK